MLNPILHMRCILALAIVCFLAASCGTPTIIDADRNRALPSASPKPQTPSSPPVTSSETPRLALVIGNGNYETFGRLTNPVNDANDMASVLKKLGFEVMLQTNANKRIMTSSVQTFGAKLARQGGVGLFYFSGHGVQYEGNNYLIPLSTQINSDADIPFEALSANRILAQMQQSNNGINLVILDACRDIYYTSITKGVSKGLARMDSPTGSLIAYATSPNTSAYGDDLSRNSIYTKHLITVLRSKPYLSITDLFTEVTGRVAQETDNLQIPWQSTSLTRQFSFQ